jgi:hypothetical protein
MTSTSPKAWSAFFGISVWSFLSFFFLNEYLGAYHIPHTQAGVNIDNNNNDTGVAFEANNSLSFSFYYRAMVGNYPFSLRLPYWWSRGFLRR